jgi:WD40 repeat protein
MLEFLTAVVLMVGANPLGAGTPKEKVASPIIGTIQAHDHHVLDIVLSEDGKQCISLGGFGSLGQSWKVWDIQSKKCLRAFDFKNAGGGPRPGACEFLPLADAFVGVVSRPAKDKSRNREWGLVQFDIKSGRERVLYVGGSDSTPVALWSKQKCIVARKDAINIEDAAFTLMVINYESGEVKRLVHKKTVKIRGFTPDRKLLALETAPNRIEVYDWERNKLVSTITATFSKFSSEICQCVFLSDNRTMIAIVDGVPGHSEKWDLRNGLAVPWTNAVTGIGKSSRVAISPDETLLATGGARFYGLRAEMKFLGAQDLRVPALEGNGLESLLNVPRFLPDGKSYLLGCGGGKILHVRTPSFSR